MHCIKFRNKFTCVMKEEISVRSNINPRDYPCMASKKHKTARQTVAPLAAAIDLLCLDAPLLLVPVVDACCLCCLMPVT